MEELPELDEVLRWNQSFCPSLCCQEEEEVKEKDEKQKEKEKQRDKENLQEAKGGPRVVPWFLL